MKSIRLVPPPRKIIVASPLKSALELLFDTAVVVGIALASVVVHWWITH